MDKYLDFVVVIRSQSEAVSFVGFLVNWHTWVTVRSFRTEEVFAHVLMKARTSSSPGSRLSLKFCEHHNCAQTSPSPRAGVAKYCALLRGPLRSRTGADFTNFLIQGVTFVSPYFQAIEFV